MTTAMIGVAWALMLATFALLGFVLVHFTARIDALEEQLQAAREAAARPISAQLGFAMEPDDERKAARS